MKFVSYLNKTIEYSYYLLFFLVPLFFTNNTSELFEMNKMWLTWGVTIVVMTAWISKMLATRRLFIQRSFFDIPILLFLLSQFLSTIFSFDMHISLWGYYSRFNGGFYSILSYILLYYAFVSNYKDITDMHEAGTARFSFPIRIGLFLGGLILIPVAILISAPPASNPEAANTTLLFICFFVSFLLFLLSLPYGFLKRILIVSLISGLLVALWGIPSHFGKDPTCLLFRGELNIHCWTEAFYPTVRMFSTLGQPAWLAAYMSVLTPLAVAFSLFGKKIFSKNNGEEVIKSVRDLFSLPSLYFVGLSTLLYLSLLYSNTKGGFIGFWVANGIFWLVILLKKIFPIKLLLQFFVIINLIFFTCNFFSSTPFEQLNYLTFSKITQRPEATVTTSTSPTGSTTAPSTGQPAAGELGGTDSGKIRLFVWKGATDIWKAYPLFGTGVETFAFAYYRFRPEGHNLTSEWDYLYNKAHNEYLNYLATTGIFGLGTYLLFIGFFIYLFVRHVLLKSQRSIGPGNTILLTGLFTGWISILISNFFGFSVVIMNLYLILIPAFALVLLDMLSPKHSLLFSKENENDSPSGAAWVGIGTVILLSVYLLFLLFRFWKADIAYALGNNLNNVQEYQQAYPHLTEAVALRPGEPIFKDELALNSATLATMLLLQKDAATNTQIQQQATQLAEQAIQLDNEVITKHPNNIVFWKNRVRIFYTLSQVQPAYLQETLNTMKQVSMLAPTDAKVFYNLGILYRSNNQLEEAKAALEKSIALKPGYRDPYYALGLTLHDMAIDKNGSVVNQELQNQAVAMLQSILKTISPTDEEVIQTLKEWNAL